MVATFSDLAIFSGRAHLALARTSRAHLEMPLGACEVSEFSNENIFVRIQENVRSRDVLSDSIHCPRRSTPASWSC